MIITKGGENVAPIPIEEVKSSVILVYVMLFYAENVKDSEIIE